MYLPKTPFYAESGGQVGDQGVIESLDGNTAFHVHDTQKVGENGVVHIGEVLHGTLEHGQAVRATVDLERRLHTARHHTATHLLHQALKETLGSHVQQAGSLVGPDYLRFDFNHFQKMTPEEIQKVESLVNEKALADVKVVSKDRVPQQEAIDSGYAALFGEKYGEKVRTVNIGDWSRELCGGTHLTRTGEMGLFRITNETSSAAGIRRIEAVAGEKVLDRLRDREQLLADVRDLLHAGDNALKVRVQHLLEQNRQLEKELQALQAAEGATDFEQILSQPQTLEYNGLQIPVFAGRVAADSGDVLNSYGDRFREEQKTGVAVLRHGDGRKSPPGRGCHRQPDPATRPEGRRCGPSRCKACRGGGGGGRPHLATAGGRNPDQLDAALAAVPGIVQDLLNSIAG